MDLLGHYGLTRPLWDLLGHYGFTRTWDFLGHYGIYQATMGPSRTL